LKLQKDFLYLPNTAAYAAEIIMAFRFSAVFQFSVQLTFVKRESHPPTPKQLQLYKAIHSPLSVRFLTKIVLILTQKKRRYDEGWNGRLLYRNSLLVSAKLNESI
jgi:hypothetical protein